MRALLCALVLVLGMMPVADAHQDAGAEQTPLARAQIEELATAGEFQAAMALAHRIADDPSRFALEADLLFRARSYRAALGRALEAHEGGVRTTLLLARGIGSALWLGDSGSARTFLPDLNAAIVALPATERPAWLDYATDLTGQIEALESQREDVQARVGLAKKVAFFALGLSVILMAWLLPRSSK